MAFTIRLLSDVAGFLKGTRSVQDSLDEVAGSLDELARDTEQNADQAGDKLAGKFSDALEKVRDDTRQTGKRIGDDLDEGARRAGDGVEGFKDEAKQSVRETAASFSDVNDALDLVQEIAANAFSGFGPAGMAAGAAAAIGIGLVKANLDQAKQKADDYIETVHTMAEALRDTGGAAGVLADSMTDIVDTKEWYEFWQKLPLDRLTLMTNTVRDLGLNSDDVFRAMTGDMEAYGRIAEQAIRNTSEAELEHTVTFLNGIRQQGEALNNAKQWNEDYANSAVAAQQRAEQAQQDAKEVAADWASSLAEHLNVAGDGLDQFVKDGKLNLKEWAEEVKRRAKDVATVENFQVDVFPKLSPEAQAEFAKLPVETQAQVAKAYQDGSKKDRKQIVTTLEAQVKVNPKVDEKGIDPVSIPATVDADTATRGTKDAADAAQAEAAKTGNVIEFKTRIDKDELQRQVNRAAASIDVPTITVKVKPTKEVP